MGEKEGTEMLNSSAEAHPMQLTVFQITKKKEREL